MHLLAVPFLQDPNKKLKVLTVAKVDCSTLHNEYLISRKGLSSVSLPNLRKCLRPEWPKIWGAPNRIRAEFRLSEQNFEQNKGLLRALPAGRINHFTSGIYPSLLWSRHCCERC